MERSNVIVIGAGPADPCQDLRAAALTKGERRGGGLR